MLKGRALADFKEVAPVQADPWANSQDDGSEGEACDEQKEDAASKDWAAFNRTQRGKTFRMTE
eukprot:4220329-Lingulodinium_polyedra.AAC.1